MVAAQPLNSEAHAVVRRLGRPALAWEILRRDPASREAYRGLSLKREGSEALDPLFSTRWGLHFP